MTFVPCFLWIFLGGPYIEALRGNQIINASLAAITAAVVGVILNLAVWFGLHTLFGDVAETRLGALRLFVPVWQTLDPAILTLTAAALLAALRYKVPMIPMLAACAVLGVSWYYLDVGLQASSTVSGL